MSVLITSVLNCASDRLAISSWLSCIFSGALKCSVIWAIFFGGGPWRVCYLKGRSLRCSPGHGNAGRWSLCCDAVSGGGAEREQWCPVPSPPDFNLSLCYPQSNWAPLVLVPDGWASPCPRPRWVSPTTSPVRLGVSPAATPTPTGVFYQRFEALFRRAGALGYAVCFAPGSLSGLSVRECGVAGSASGQTACPVGPTLCQSRSCHGSVSPLSPGCPSLPLLLV